METWGMVNAKRARTAERPKQPSTYLNLRAPCFYPDPSSNLGTTLWGIEYDAPFGVAPVGLQGLQQIMEQLGCERLERLSKHLIRP
jgi:hypothetical protein